MALEDVKRVALPVPRHRMLLNFQAEADGIDTDEIVSRLREHHSGTVSALTVSSGNNR